MSEGSDSTGTTKRLKSETVFLARTSQWIDSYKNPDRVEEIVGVFRNQLDAYRAAVRAASKELLDKLEHHHERHVENTRHGTTKCEACKALKTCRAQCGTCPACAFAESTESILAAETLERFLLEFEGWKSSFSAAAGECEYSDNDKATQVVVREYEIL